MATEVPSAPATCLLLGELRDEYGPMPRGSIVVLSETDTADPADLSLGTGAPPQMLADQIHEMCRRHRFRRPFGWIDDARGLQSETVISLMREAGIFFNKPLAKDRVGTWAHPAGCHDGDWT